MLKPESTQGETAWFVHDRFGLFIHWGTYAQAARHEWVKSHEKMPDESYQEYFNHFEPDLYNPREWAVAAKNAGMKYFVITTKHHEGFCLWDSQFTENKAPNSPARRDLLTPMVEAFREEGLRVGFYYSLIDWSHPHFPIDPLHPMRDHADAAEINRSRDVRIYAEYMRDQVRELLMDFGEIDILWFDYSYPEMEHRGMKGKGKDDWESEKLLQLVRDLAPNAIVNNRLDLPDVPADIHTPEQYQPAEWIKVDGKPVVWEACQTLSGSWGYHRDENTWKSPEQLITLLIDTVSKGGNLLMNVGPTARGVLDTRALNALESYGDWMRWNERSIRGATQANFTAPSDVRYTQNFQTNRLYAHLLGYPFKHLHLPGLEGKVEYAQFLHDASEVTFRDNKTPGFAPDGFDSITPEGALTLYLPLIKPGGLYPVIELFLK